MLMPPDSRPLSSQISVQPATTADTAEIARIHFEALPGDFLPSLGIEFLERVYYPAALSSAFAGNFVAVGDAGPVGFVTIAHDGGAFSREVMRRALVPIARYAIRAALRDPRHLRLSLEVCWSVVNGRPDPVKGEIFLIAVARAARSQGVGQALVQAAMQYLREHHVDQCRTKTLAANGNVIRMYERLGWQIREQFDLIGRTYVTIDSPRQSVE